MLIHRPAWQHEGALFSMSEPHPTHRRRKHRKNRSRLGAVLVCLAAAVAVVYGIDRAVFREPEQKQTTPPDLPPQAAQSAAAAVSVGGSSTEAEDPMAHYVRKEGFYTILVSGVDNGNGGSDTNILVAVDVGQKRIYGVSIPRDSKAVLGGKTYKINAAYNIGGVERMAQAVSDQLGIPVDYTVEVDLQGFAAVIDAIGGVDFYIPVDMDYDDPYQDLAIHFSKGLQHLNGEEALKVVRFRHNNDGTGYGSEDIGRMETQQNFLKAVAKQTLTVDNLGKLDDFVRIFQRHVDTDLTLGNLAWLGKAAVEIGAENIDFSTLPGEWKSPYLYLDAEAVLQVVNEHLNPYTEDRTAADLNIPS